ncbi:MAG: hypothetical protein ABMB14_03015 [Myxococcota bacterium]
MISLWTVASADASPSEPSDPSDPSEPSGPGDPVDAVLARFAAEPSIADVQRWASEQAELDPAQVRRWLRQSSSFALLPEVTVDLSRRDDWGAGYEYYDPAGADPLPGETATAVADDADQGRTQEVALRLQWQLADLVMSSERIRVIHEAQDVVKLRDDVLTEVTRLYFERRRLQVEQQLAPKIDPVARAADQLRLLELTANLDALTAGAFSSAVARSGRSR